MASDVLTKRDLNRALLARQMLLVEAGGHGRRRARTALGLAGPGGGAAVRRSLDPDRGLSARRPRADDPRSSGRPGDVDARHAPSGGGRRTTSRSGRRSSRCSTRPSSRCSATEPRASTSTRWSRSGRRLFAEEPRTFTRMRGRVDGAFPRRRRAGDGLYGPDAGSPGLDARRLAMGVSRRPGLRRRGDLARERRPSPSRASEELVFALPRGLRTGGGGRRSGVVGARRRPRGSQRPAPEARDVPRRAEA